MSSFTRLRLRSGALADSPPQGSLSAGQVKDPSVPSLPFEHLPLGGFRSLALLGLGIAASLSIHGTTAVTDQPDQASAAATLPVAVESSATDAPDLSTGAMALAVAASGADRDLADATSGDVALPIAATGALQDQGDASAGAVALSIGASSSLGDAPDGAASSGSVGSAGFRSLALLPLSVGALADVGINASASLIDGQEKLLSTAGPGVLLTSINTTDAYRITATPDLIVGDRIEVLSAVGGPVSDVTINPDATFTIASGSGVTSFDIRIWSITDQEWGPPATQTVGLNCTSALIDQADLAQGSMGATIGATAALSDQRDISAASAVVTVGASAALADQVDKVAAASALAIAASGALQDLADTSSGASALAIAISCAARDLPDLCDALGGAPQNVATAALIDSLDKVSSAGVSVVGISGSLQDQIERIAASVTLPLAATSSQVDLGDGTIAAVVLSVQGTAALREDELQLAAEVALAVAANFTGRERADLIASSLVYVVPEPSGGVRAELVLPARAYATNIPSRTFALSQEARSFNLTADARTFPLVKP